MANGRSSGAEERRARERSWRVSGADALTASRVALAPAIGVATGAGHIGLGAIGLGLAWLTDVFDGRAARRSGIPGRLAGWDLHVDTLVGASLLFGITFHGSSAAIALGIAGVVAASWYLTSGKPAASMTLQALAYGALLAMAWRDARAGFWWLAAIIAFIAVLDRARLVEWVLPTFFEGWRRGGG